jgi:hypothetical protein
MAATLISGALADFQNAKPAKSTVYHYTSQEGLLGILPQWSLQKRPTVVRAKPANANGPGLCFFTLSPRFRQV